MLSDHKSMQKLTLLCLASFLTGITLNAQTVKRVQPVWWFGESVAANFNTYRGTTQMLNNDLTVPTAFHKGNGVKPYASVLTEYRPNKKWGGMLNLAFDNRGGKFDGVMAPCDCPAGLSTSLSYLALEPSLRLAPFSNSFYLFAGPTFGINLSKKFDYTQDKQTDKRGTWSDINKTVLSAQVGAGIDVPLSAPTNRTQVALSPFASFQTDLGKAPRSVGSWSVYTVRAGVALKFGTSKKSTPVTTKAEPIIAIEKEVQFSVRAPKIVPVKRQVKETFPLLNSVFFDKGRTEIPTRYVQLNTNEAKAFKEEQLQQSQPANLANDRSARQLAVYHNILNIIGDRLRVNEESAILLSGASEKNPAEGKILAENIKQYLVSQFGIKDSRISTEGRDKPQIPSEQPGATNELPLLREGDRRVDIVSTSPELMLQVGGVTSPYLKPIQITAVQQDPLDSHVIFTVGGASEVLQSWNVDVTDEQGNVQHYGPYTAEKASIPGQTILGNNAQGNYKIVMSGQTKTGHSIKKESSVSLLKADEPKGSGLRYSILFGFDKSETIASYEKFLTDIIAPMINENSTVIIHGHTDIIGDEKYNHSLSHERAMGTQKIIERALSARVKNGVKYETYGFGEELSTAPFENNMPEERFYNRSVIIDIVSN